MLYSGSSSAWLERLVWDQEVAGSNPVSPTNKSKMESGREVFSEGLLLTKWCLQQEKSPRPDMRNHLDFLFHHGYIFVMMCLCNKVHRDRIAGIAQLVERNLAKVDVAGSSPVSRSIVVDGDVPKW